MINCPKCKREIQFARTACYGKGEGSTYNHGAANIYDCSGYIHVSNDNKVIELNLPVENDLRIISYNEKLILANYDLDDLETNAASLPFKEIDINNFDADFDALLNKLKLLAFYS